MLLRNWNFLKRGGGRGNAEGAEGVVILSVVRGVCCGKTLN